MSHADNNANAASGRQERPQEEAIRTPGTLHSCPHPWKHGDRMGPIQLRSTEIKEHHRSILAILNRITNTNMQLTMRRATELLTPSVVGPEGPSLNDLREDLVSMLFEKAQDEDLYLKDYSRFLRGVSNNIADMKPTPQQLLPSSHPLYGELLLPLEDLIRLEWVKTFERLYESLKMLYSKLQPWNSEKERITRKKLVTHLKFMVHLYNKSLLPWDELHSVKETFAKPLTDFRLMVNVPNVNLAVNNVEFADDAFLLDLQQSPHTGVSITALAAEMLSIFLFAMGHLNLADRGGTRARSEELCNILRRIMNSLSTRQMYLVMRTLDLQSKGWRGTV